MQSWEPVLRNQVATAVGTIVHRETEWDGAKLQAKFLEYLSKASKSVSGRKDWVGLVQTFCEKFYEAFWRSLGDRVWLEDIDFTLAVGVAIHAYCDPGVLASVPSEEEYMRVVSQSAVNAFDSSRYYNWGWQVVKTVITNKASSKKVREALDETREVVVKEQHTTMEGFIASWIKLTVEFLAKSGNPKMSLSVADANSLFNKLIKEGGGMPLPLLRAAPLPPPDGWSEVANAIDLAYSSYPDVSMSGGGKGWGKSGGGGGYGSSSSYGPVGGSVGSFDPNQIAAMMAMFQQAAAAQGKGHGYSPY